MAKKAVAKKPVKKTRVRTATQAERKMLEQHIEETDDDDDDTEKQSGEGYQGEEDFYVSEVFLSENQGVVCFEQAHKGAVGFAVGKIIENILPSGSFQNLVVDHTDRDYKYYSLFLKVN